MQNKKGQVTIFIIIAVLIVAAVAVYFAVRGSFGSGVNLPADMKPIYADFLSCLEQNVLTGADILETQAGYIELPAYEPGSQYSPFSSQLNFLGNPIPYWYYVSGNNIQKEQIPTEREMEVQLEKYLETAVDDCSFDSYYSEGYQVYTAAPKANVVINSGDIDLTLDMDMDISKNNENVVVRNHNVNVKTNLGKLYSSAVKIYEYEQKNLFLEEYAVDNLRLYAPVDGFEMTCAPKIWNADEVFNELQDAVEVNTLALRTGSNRDNYFNIDLPVGENVRFINSKNWSNNYEVNPSEGVFMITSPVGNQAGLGVLGFCYATYHFVYNVKYPVLIQVYDEPSGEIFQFPVAVVLEGNNPRKALNGTATETLDTGFCENKNVLTSVKVYDSKLNEIDAYVSYECSGNSCEIGQTTAGVLQTEFPQCVNGYIIARAEGYREARYLHSSVTPDSATIILDKLYDLDVNLKLDGTNYNGDAVITFTSDGDSKTVVYPEQKDVLLSQGLYNVSVQIYRDSSLKVGESTYEECTTVPAGSVGGLFGFTSKKCYDITLPEQIVSNALAGGGTESYYISEQELESSNAIEISAEGLETPETLDELQQNYILYETKGLEILFR